MGACYGYGYGYGYDDLLSEKPGGLLNNAASTEQPQQ